MDHENANPWSYTVQLPKAIEGVRSIKLLNYSMGISSAFIVIRRSKWLQAGTPPDSIAIQCGVRLYNDGSVGTTTMQYKYENGTNTHANIYNTAGTVALDVFDAFYAEETRPDGSGDYRTYSVFVCTGTLGSTDTDLWYLNDRSSTVFAQPMVMTDAINGTSDDAALASTNTPGTSVIFTTTQHTDLYMMLKVNGTLVQRLGGARATSFPKWSSYHVYRKGDIISRGANLSYQCAIRHLSIDFSVELSAKVWVAIGADLSPAVDGAYYVVQPTRDNQDIIEKTFSKNQVVYETLPFTVSSVQVEWLNRTGTQIMWPATYALEYVVSTGVETAKRVFHQHSFTLEMEHVVKT